MTQPRNHGPTRPAGDPSATRLPESAQKVGNYVLRSKLGEGAMGQVWLAHDRLLDRNVAIKLLKPEIAADEQRLRDFITEARATAKLNHSNIVTIFGASRKEGRCFIVMEYVEAGSLSDELRDKGALPWRDATQAIRDAAAGLEVAHDAGLVHRDVKPSNLMRSARGLVKVVDFGLARSESADPEHTQTQPGTLLGSPGYMSPEQCRGERADARSDLYSLICGYYQLLTRQLPFAGNDITAVMYQHCHEPFPDAGTKMRGLPDGVLRILAKGSQKKPEDRYQSATQLLVDLDALLCAPDVSLTFDSSSAGPLAALATSNLASPPRRSTSQAIISALKGKGLIGKLAWAGAVALIGVTVAIVLHRRSGASNPNGTGIRVVDVTGHGTPTRQAAPPSRPAAGTNLLKNGSFTEGNLTPDGWKIPDEVKGKLTMARDTTDFAVGPASMRVSIDQEQSGGSVVQRFDAPTEGSLHISGFLKTSNDFKGHASVILQRGDANWHAATFARITAAGGKHDWAPFSADVQLPLVGVRSPEIKAEVEGDRGTAWFDELQVEYVPPAAAGLSSNDAIDASSAKEFVNTVGMKFVRIEPGEFLMGSPATEGGRGDDETQHKVKLTKPFLMGIHHVTRGQFAAFVKDTAYPTDAEKSGWAYGVASDGSIHQFKGASWNNPGFGQTDDHPVVQVSWNDAQAFCKWLSRKEGKTYRLPTEAQWEYAYRAGTSTAYFWGDSPDGGVGFANGPDLTCKENFHGADFTPFNWRDGFVFTSPVGSFKPNHWGLYDMAGNASEWCSDVYAPFDPGDAVDPAKTGGGNKVMRGGSWYCTALNGIRQCRAANREKFHNGHCGFDNGFRVCLEM